MAIKSKLRPSRSLRRCASDARFNIVGEAFAVLVRWDNGDVVGVVDERLDKVFNLLLRTELDQDVDDAEEPDLILQDTVGIVASKASFEVGVGRGGQGAAFKLSEFLRRQSMVASQ